jgi:hypothetical protein
LCWVPTTPATWTRESRSASEGWGAVQGGSEARKQYYKFPKILSTKKIRKTAIFCLKLANIVENNGHHFDPESRNEHARRVLSKLGYIGSIGWNIFDVHN